MSSAKIRLDYSPASRDIEVGARLRCAQHQYPPEHAMIVQRSHLLILDVDEGALLTLQQILEDAGFDTTITWDQTEALHLVRRTPYDLILVGDHPPELAAERVLNDFTSQGRCRPSLILAGSACETTVPHLSKLGVIGVVPKREPVRVLEHVRKYLTASTAQPLRAIAS